MMLLAFAQSRLCYSYCKQQEPVARQQCLDKLVGGSRLADWNSSRSLYTDRSGEGHSFISHDIERCLKTVKTSERNCLSYCPFWAPNKNVLPVAQVSGIHNFTSDLRRHAKCQEWPKN